MQSRFNRWFWAKVFWATVMLIAGSVPGPAVSAPQNWIVDRVTACGTTSQFTYPNEWIRWYGACRNGKLEGQGTLIWYRGGKEAERNVGAFKDGEFHGEVISTYPDGQVVVGQYIAGRRDGEFVVKGADGRYIHAVYRDGKMGSQRLMSDQDIMQWEGSRAHTSSAAVIHESLAVIKKAEYAENKSTVAAVNEQHPSSPRGSSGEESKGFFSRMADGVGGFLTGALDLLSFGVSDKDAAPVADRVETTSSAVRSAAPPKHHNSENPPKRQMSASAPVTPNAGQSARPASREVAAAPPRNPAPVQRPEGSSGTVSDNFRSRTFRDLQLAYGGSLYDMQYLLNEPHPFANVIVPSVETVPLVSSPSSPSSPLAVKRDGSAIGAVPPDQQSGPGVIVYEKPTEGGQIDPRFSDPVQWQLPKPLVPEGNLLAALPRLKGPGADLPAQPASATLASLPEPRQVGSVTSHSLQQENPDSLFNLGYRYERAGQYYEAEQSYEKILVEHPSSQTALLANARLNDLRKRNEDKVVHSHDAEQGLPAKDSVVVAVNSPQPPVHSPSITDSGNNLGMTQRTPVLYRTVCSRKGLYEDGARWCGIVTQEEKQHYLVEVRDIRVGGFGTIGIGRSMCTGNNFLNWFSRGSAVRVPKKCMALKN